MKPIRQLISCIVTTCLICGCDTVMKDTGPATIDATLYGFSDKPAVLAVNAVAGGLDLKATIDQNTSYGNLSTLVNGKYLLYQPGSSFTGKSESIVVPLIDGKKATSRVLNLTMKSLDNGTTGCTGTPVAISGHYKIKSGETLTVDILENTVFCGLEYHSGAGFGPISLEGENNRNVELYIGPGRIMKFQYTASADFVGTTKVLYAVGFNILGDATTMPTLEEALANPKKYYQAFAAGIIQVDVSN